MAMQTDNRTLGEMFTELTRSTRTLIQQEVQLTKTELAEKASMMGRGAALVLGGGLLVYGGFLTLMAAVVLGLVAVGMAPWAAALLGAALLLLLGGLLVRAGFHELRPRKFTPRQTIDSFKEDVRWLRSHT